MTSESNRDRWNERDYEPSPAEPKQMMAEAYRPGILLNKMPFPDDPGAPGCWLGGEPTLPPEIDWPSYIFDGEPLVPMHFMEQINLAEVPRLEQYPWVPETGTWFFFYAPVMFAEFGRATIGVTDPGGRIFYVPQDASAFPERSMPSHPSPKTLADQSFFDEEDLDLRYQRLPLTGLKKWNFDFLKFDQHRVSSFANAPFRQQAVQANINARRNTINLTKNRRLGEERGSSSTFYDHHLFGASYGELQRGLFSLSSYTVDKSLNYIHQSYEKVVFWTRNEPLNSPGNLDMFLSEED
ncbi:MAG: DUF1963 domain-containing protein [Pseudomonadota bacterium]